MKKYEKMENINLIYDGINNVVLPAILPSNMKIILAKNALK